MPEACALAGRVDLGELAARVGRRGKVHRHVLPRAGRVEGILVHHAQVRMGPSRH